MSVLMRLAPLVVVALLAGSPSARAEGEPGVPALPSGPAESAADTGDFPAGTPAIAAPVPFESPPPSHPLTKRWADADDMTVTFLRGGLGTCRSITYALRLEPNVGVLVSILLEWACVPPTVLAVDYAQRAHGRRGGNTWQAVISVGAAKVWRDLMDLPVVVNFALLTLGVSSAAASTVLLGVIAFAVSRVQDAPLDPRAQGAVVAATALAPVALSFSFTYAAVVFLVLNALKDPVSEFLFMALYGLLTPQFATEVDQWKAQRAARIRPSLGVVERAFMLSAVTMGTGAAFSWWHFIPVVGPFIRAFHRFQAVKQNLRRVAADDFREEKHDHERAEFVLASLLTLEATVSALSHAAILLNLALFGVTVVGALLQAGAVTQARLEIAGVQIFPLAITAGVALTALSTVALFLLVLRQAPEALLPILVPVAYGLWPDAGLFPPRADD